MLKFIYSNFESLVKIGFYDFAVPSATYEPHTPVLVTIRGNRPDDYKQAISALIVLAPINISHTGQFSVSNPSGEEYVWITNNYVGALTDVLYVRIYYEKQ